MGQTNISIRIDESIKKQFDSLCNELGLSMSSLINVFIKKAIREQGVPFSVSINDYNEETRKTIEETERRINLVGPFNSTEDLMNSLLTNDGDNE